MNKFFLIISGLILFLNAALSQTVVEINLCNGIQAPALSEPEDHPNSGGQRPYIVKHTWFSSDDNVTYSPITGANLPAYQPPVLTSIKYYKLRYTYYNYVADPRYLYLYSKTYIITTYAPVASGVVTGEQTNCYNSVPTQLSATAATGGDGNFTYQWQYSTDNVQWFDITGANQLNYPPSNLTITTRYRIRSHSTAGCGDVYSNAVTVTVFDPLTIGNISGNQSICYSSSASPLNGSVASGGFGPFTYRWQYSSDNSSWSDIATADQLSYTPVNVRQNTYYRLGAQGNFCGNIYSNSVVVNVYPEVQGGTIGNAQTICYNSSPNNLLGTPGSGGYGLYSYTWYYSYDNNNFYEIFNSNNKDFQPGSLTKSTYYKRMTADNCGLEYTANLLISVNAELKGTSVSGDQSICSGAIINTLVGENPSGGDGGYSYKWQKSMDNNNWNDVVNSNSKDYQPFNVTQTSYFRRITFTNSCGSATSNVVTVAVKEAATPGSIGSDQVICYNTKPYTLVNTNSPTGTYTVKWQSFNNSSWSDIPGAADVGYSPNELTVSTKYRRVITDVCSSVNSNEVTITVLPAVSPGVIASDQTICYKATANSMVGGSASGSDGSFTYKWQRSGDKVNWEELSGTNALSYYPGSLEKTTSYRRIAISGRCGETSSNTVTITVNPELKNINVATDQTICSGAIINSLVGETPTGGDGAYTYKWQKSIDNSNWNDVVNSNSKDHQPVNVTQTTFFRRITFTNSCGSATSNVVTVAVKEAATPGTIGSDQTICYNTKPFTLVNTNTPTGTYTVKWQSFNNSSWSDIPGVVDLSFSPNELISTTKYRRVITDVCSSVNSIEVVITVLPAVNPGVIASDQTVCYKATANSMVGGSASGSDGSFTYKWQRSADKVNWEDLFGTNALSFYPGSLDKTTSYRRVAISGRCGETSSNVVTISVNPELKNTNIAADQDICFGASINSLIGESPSGGDGSYTYKWQQSADNSNWSEIVNSTNKDFQPVNVTKTSYFKRITFTNSCGNAVSNAVKISVTPELVPGVISATQIICEGTRPSELTGTVASGADNIKYQWESSISGEYWEKVSGANDLNYQPDALIASKYFRRLATSTCGSKNTNSVYVTILAKPAAPTIATKPMYCKDQDITLSPSNNTFSYEWYDQQGSVIKTGSSLTISKIARTETIAVKAINSNNCKSDAQSIVLTVDQVKAGFSANAFAITKGDFVQFSSSSTNAALYLWNFFEGENSTKEGPLKYYYSTGSKNVKLTVTSQSGCRDSVTMVNYITVTGATSVEGLNQKGFSIYPNPALESLTVESQNSGPFVISLTNLEGKTLMVEEGLNLDKLVLDCSGLPQGVYVLKIGQERGEVTFKVIKQ